MDAIFIILFMLFMRHILFLELDLLILEIGPFEVCLTINVPLLQTLNLPVLALEQSIRGKQARQQDHSPLPQQSIHLHLSLSSISVAKLAFPFYPRPDLPRLHLRDLAQRPDQSPQLVLPRQWRLALQTHRYITGSNAVIVQHHSEFSLLPRNLPAADRKFSNRTARHSDRRNGPFSS